MSFEMQNDGLDIFKQAVPGSFWIWQKPRLRHHRYALAWLGVNYPDAARGPSRFPVLPDDQYLEYRETMAFDHNADGTWTLTETNGWCTTSTGADH